MAIPTRFINGGVTTVPVTDVLGMFGMPDPTQWITFFNDFTISANAPIAASGIADNADWDVTIVETGANDTAVALLDGNGGLLTVTCDVNDNDGAFFRKKPESFRWAADKRMFFKARFKLNESIQVDSIFGLVITDTTPLDASDGIFFLKTDGAATLDFKVVKDSSSTAVLTAVATLVDDTFITVGFAYNGRPRTTNGTTYYDFACFINGVGAGTVAATTEAPDDEDLSVTFGVQQGEAVNAKILTVDYIAAFLER